MSGDETFEPLDNVKDLSALDEYLKLKGVVKWEDLPKPARATPKMPAKRALGMLPYPETSIHHCNFMVHANYESLPAYLCLHEGHDH